jgi:hypothetical protein
MLFKDKLAVYSENHINPTNKKHSVTEIKVAGTYNYHYALKG